MLSKNNITTISPLKHMAAVNGKDIKISENPLHGKITIRADIDNKSIVKKIETVLAMDVPAVCKFSESKNCRLIWVGPNELLFYCPIGEVAIFSEKIEKALKNSHHAVVDVSDYYVTLCVSGASARQLLNSECPLDLHPSIFKKGHCAGTLFAHATILLQALDGLSFDLQVRWSFAGYLMMHLGDGAKFYNHEG